jgi:hypothetical protein
MVQNNQLEVQQKLKLGEALLMFFITFLFFHAY